MRVAAMMLTMRPRGRASGDGDDNDDGESDGENGIAFFPLQFGLLSTLSHISTPRELQIELTNLRAALHCAINSGMSLTRALR